MLGAMKYLLVLMLLGAPLLASRTGRADVPPATVIYPEAGVAHVHRGSAGQGQPRSPGTALQASGIVLTSVGGLGTFLGIIYFSLYGIEGTASTESKALSVGSMAGGAAMTTSGIAMIVAGRAKNARARRLHPMAVDVGPRAARVRVSF